MHPTGKQIVDALLEKAARVSGLFFSLGYGDECN